MKAKQTAGRSILVLLFPLIVIELAWRAGRQRVRLFNAYRKELARYGID